MNIYLSMPGITITVTIHSSFESIRPPFFFGAISRHRDRSSAHHPTTRSAVHTELIPPLAIVRITTTGITSYITHKIDRTTLRLRTRTASIYGPVLDALESRLNLRPGAWMDSKPALSPP